MIKDLRKKTDLELGDLISKLKVQLLEMRFKMANGQVNEVHKISGIKKTIAMAMTVLSERDVKISFSTHSIQLIKNKNNKQEISSIKVSSLATDQPTNKTNKKVVSTNTNKPKQGEDKNKAKTDTNKKVNTSQTVSKKPASKPSTNSNIKTSSKKQSVQIRRSAKG